MKVISQFPSSEILGLGRTHVEEHNIDTKDAQPIKSKCYPVSPVIQGLINTEIDRIRELESPVTLVRKPNKNRLCL